MNQCNPVEMRKNLEVVEHFKHNMIDFVVVPVKNQGHKNGLIALCQKIFEEILEDCE